MGESLREQRSIYVQIWWDFMSSIKPKSDIQIVNPSSFA